MVEGFGTAAVGALVERLIDAWWRERHKRRQLIAEVSGGLGRESQGAIEQWLDQPLVWRQLLSEDEAVRRLAEQLLRDAFGRAGTDPPADLGPVLASARDALLARRPPALVIHQAKEELLAGQELLGQQVEDLRDQLGSAGRPRLAPSVEAALGRMAVAEQEQGLRSFLTSRPTEAGFRRLLAADHPLVGTDHHGWEAVAREASGREFHKVASDVWARAATFAPDPGRCLAYEAVCAIRTGDTHRARTKANEALDEGASTLSTAAAALLREDWDELIGLDDDRLDLSDSDDRMTSICIAQAYVENGHYSHALRIAGRLADHDPAGGATLLADVLLDRVRAGESDDRMADLNRALKLASAARETQHGWGWPATGPTRLTLQAAFETGDLAAAIEIARDSAAKGFVQELDHPEVAERLALAEQITGESVGHDIALREFHRRFLAAMRPVHVAGEVPDQEYVHRLNDALSVAENDGDVARALQALARVGQAPNDRVDELAGRQPLAADIIRAHQMAALGETDAAIHLLRPHAHTRDEAAGALFEILEHAGRRDEAVRSALAAWRRLGDLMLLILAVDATEAAINDLDAGTVRAVDEAARQALGDQAITSRQRSELLRRLVRLAAKSGRWDDTVEHCRQLQRIDNSPGTRWQLAVGYVNTGRLLDAWRTVTPDGRLLEPVDLESLDLLTRLAVNFSADPDHVHQLLDYAQDADGDIGPVALGAVILSGRLDSSTAGRRAYEALDAYVDANPDTRLVKRVTVDEERARETLEGLAPGPNAAMRKLERDVLLGRLPIGIGAMISGKPVSEMLVTRDDKILQAASQNPGARSEEMWDARRSLEHGVVLDVTTIYVLGRLEQILADTYPSPGPAAHLIAHFSEVLIPVEVALDISNAQGGLAHRTAGTLHAPPEPGQPYTFFEVDDETQERRRELIETMNSLINPLPRIGPPETSRLIADSDRSPPLQSAVSAGEVALANNLPIWCDDGALREMLRTEGIVTFGTRSLLDVLHEAGFLAGAEHAKLLRALREANVADLPIPYDAVVDLARSNDYSAGTATIPLLQPGWWAVETNVQGSQVEDLFAEVANNNPNALPGWMHAAAVGMAQRGNPYLQAPRLLLTLMGRVEALRDHAAALVEAIDTALSLFGRGLVADDLQRACNDLIEAGALSGDPQALLGELLPGVDLSNA